MPYIYKISNDINDKLYIGKTLYTIERRGYTKHVEIHHIKGISTFPDDTPINIINDINNLIAVCPNHHWELENGYISI